MTSINQLVALVGLLAAASCSLAVDEATKPHKWSKKQQQHLPSSAVKQPKFLSAHCQDIGRGCYRCKDPSDSSSYVRCYDETQRLRSRRQLDGSAYRFGDEHFEEPSPVPSSGSKSTDHCKRVRRDSMLCMVCKDPKTNAKYEQCSYVPGRPFSGISSSKPKSEKQRQKQPRKPVKSSSSSSEEEDEEPHAPQPTARKQTYHYPGYSEDDYGYSPYSAGSSSSSASGSAEAQEASPEQLKSASSEKGCKKVNRDGEDCTVCTDPSTGAKSERCNYAFQPKDKAYAYTKSKSFGYPDSPQNNYHHSTHSEPQEDEEEQSPEKLSADEDEEEDDYSGAPNSDYIRSESERISQQVGADSNNCREERRDSMLCRICKDPNSGDDLEQCNYSYEPADKHYAYLKSRHFGSDDEASREPQESQLHASSALYSAPPAKDSQASSHVDTGFADASLRRAEIESIVEDMQLHDRANCTKSFRGGMTCYSCKDQRGFRNEECVFVTDTEPAASSTSTTSKTTTTTTTSGRSRRQSQEGSQQQQSNHDIDYEAAEAKTRPVYDPRLGLSLPAYMLERSPLEIEFDKSFLHN